MILAALFLFAYSTALTLAPAARLGSWDVAYNWGHWASLLFWLALIALAHRQTARCMPERDPYLLPIAALLSGWGILSIWRLFPAFGLRQSLWLLVALSLFILGLRLPENLNFLRRYKYVWLTTGLLLTGLTLLFGTNPSGSAFPRLWLGCCGLYFQPSEPLKILLVVYLAAYLASGTDGSPASRTIQPKWLPLLAPTMVMTGLALLLLIAQRDLGTASIFLFLYTAIVYVATGKKRMLFFGGLALMLAATIGYFLFDVVRLRIDAWINPWLDPSGDSYQIVQSLVAIANGGLVGRGPGMGSPGLVPVPHSDFIFTAIAEEFGLLGSVGLLLLYGILASRGLSIALSAADAFRRYMAAGLTAHLVAQSILIIGGNLRLLPLTGVTLPFVSYGGSSLLTSFFSLLILLLISKPESLTTALTVNTRPYLQLGGFLLAGLAANALAAGWWGFYRAPDLVARTDNPRRAISDRYVYRGAILDRHNEPLATTLGQPGSYTRQVQVPDLSPVIGYTNPVYGQSGVEAGLDGYLRGLQGYPEMDVWRNHLLYGQPPPGRDVRLTLDADLQNQADSLLAGKMGAAVLLNAATGEILVMASHPTFDANRLDQDWDALIRDPQTPLINRATLGRYPTGTLQDLLFPAGQAAPELSPSPQIRIPTGDIIASPGEPGLLLSPLQVALAAASLSADGLRPAPRLIQSVDIPRDGWVVLPALDAPVQAIPAAVAAERTGPLAVNDRAIWQTVETIPNEAGQNLTWYVGGTLPDWNSAPMAVAVVLEEGDPGMAEVIGENILDAAMQRSETLLLPVFLF